MSESMVEKGEGLVEIRTCAWFQCHYFEFGGLVGDGGI